MGEVLRLRNPAIEVDVRRSARARRMSLRVSRLDGQVTLTIPPRTSLGDAERFATSQSDWLRRQTSEVVPPTPVGLGGEVLFKGRLLPIREGTSKSVECRDDALLVPSGTSVGGRLQGFLKAQARDALAAASDRYAGALGVSYQRLTLRDTRSRWGSCTMQGGLMYSWRLIMAPEAVLDYVAAHEVAHLREMNHSSDFWSLVGTLMPDYETPRRWLKDNGATLHRYRFD